MEPRRALHRSSFVIFATALLLVRPVAIHAQSSTVTCLSSFGWMNNSENQNPCLVSAYLQAACTGGQFTVNPLPVGSHYTGPLAIQSNPCQCSSVTYSTISACGLCQNSSIISWSSWYFNCSTIYPEAFTPGIPDGTSVPQWAFQNVTISDSFNVTLAQIIGDAPESTAIARSTVFATSASTSVPASLTNSASALPANLASQNKTNTGAIAGGVVGGVVGVALVAGAIVFFIMRRRKRSHPPPSAMFTDLPSPAKSPPATIPSPGYSDSATFPSTTQPKLYDPLDPSTYPSSLSPGPPHPITNMNGSSVLTSTISYSNPSVMRNGGGYTGVPEV